MKQKEARAALRTEKRGQRNALDNRSGSGTSSKLIRIEGGKAIFERANGVTFSLGVQRAVRRKLVEFDPSTGFYFQT